MTNMSTNESSYKQSNTGSIDYHYYDKRARNIRSESAWKFIKAIFTGKIISRVDASKDCDVMFFNKSIEQQNKLNSLKEAA